MSSEQPKDPRVTRRDQEAALLGALFRASGEWMEGGELARQCGLRQEEIPDVLASYRAAGYSIEFHPQGGTRLLGPPDVWSAEEILGRCPRLPDSPVWNPLLLAETASTNDVARDQATRGATAGFVVAAARQTRGRGRLGRRWESARDAGLYVSVLLRPALAVRDAGQLTILSSVAMADAVKAVAEFRPQIKWPNDLVVEGRKLAGLLIETERAGPSIAWAVIGIGLNVNHELADFPPELQDMATSLRIIAGRSFRRADLLVALLHALATRIARPFAEAREAWAESSLTVGQRVKLTTLRGVLHGQAIGLDPSGALLLRLESGEVEVVTAGDMQAC